MNLGKKIKNVFSDVRSFGPRFALKALSAKVGARKGVFGLPVNGIGTIFVRANNSDVSVLRQIFKDGEYDLRTPSATFQRIMRRYEEVLATNRSPVIVDAGANIGASALLFEQLFPKAVVVSVEPDPENCAVLRQNLAKRSQHIIMEAAIGAAKGFVALSGNGHGWAVQTERTHQGVPIVTVQDVFAQVPDGEPFLVKVDIEGFEKDLFSDNLAWIDDIYALFVEPHDWMLPGQGTSVPFQRAVFQRGFELYIKGENLLFVRPA